MLSSVLNSERAIQVNIQIIRNFVRLRQLLATNEQLARKLQELEKRYDSQFQQVFRVITKLMVSEADSKGGGKIGFLQDKG
jgi:chromosome condensin MukBEF ATPase and DNA-binding subunit MukB